MEYRTRLSKTEKLQLDKLARTEPVGESKWIIRKDVMTSLCLSSPALGVLESARMREGVVCAPFVSASLY